jgi:hypothetical protein
LKNLLFSFRDGIYEKMRHTEAGLVDGVFQIWNVRRHFIYNDSRINSHKTLFYYYPAALFPLSSKGLIPVRSQACRIFPIGQTQRRNGHLIEVKKTGKEEIDHEVDIRPAILDDENDSASIGPVGFSDLLCGCRPCHTLCGCRSMRAENAWYFVFSALQHEIYVQNRWDEIDD